MGMPRPQVVTSDFAAELAPPQRSIGSGNIVLGGLLLVQQRTTQSHVARCRTRWSGHDSACVQLPDGPGHADAHQAGFGRDPAWNPASPLFSSSAQGQEAVFYKTSWGSNELVAATQYPFGFFPWRLPGLPRGLDFPVLIPVCHALPVQSWTHCSAPLSLVWF